ncbi:MAG: hypothetical protein RMK29_06750 [Myxococcales bacterium]|nr:hypothetical protein [Myxococcota bacterium]MDW8281393.1 hypothetical protein [Myxococcales bacterium]
MTCSACKSGCGRQGGCSSRKAEQSALLDRLLPQLYPERCWGQPDCGIGLLPDEVCRLQRDLATVLRAPTYLRPGEPDDLCSFIYVLCLGREPALLEVRDHGLELLPDGGLDEAAHGMADRYLRIALSHLARLAAVQEVALELDLGRRLAPSGMAVVREIPRAGVFDPRLLKRLQRTVDFLQAHDIEHLDMGLLERPAAHWGLRPGQYLEQYGVAPTLFNFLFQAQPVPTVSACYLPLPRPEAADIGCDIG